MADVAGTRVGDGTERPLPGRVAFYDFDGTLVSGNVVTRYVWFAKRHPSRWAAAWRFSRVVLWVPVWLLLDALSRKLFNILFFRQYRGLREDWLRDEARSIVGGLVRREQFRHARDRVALDRASGYQTVLVTGGLDFEVAPAADYFGFDDLMANRLEFRHGVATGAVLPPLLAGTEKAAVLQSYARSHGFRMSEAKAYSDSYSDLPMLEAVGSPFATNPSGRLRKAALSRDWPILDLDRSPTHAEGSDPA